MNHPVRDDFTATVAEAGVTVTFKPTQTIFSFYRLAGGDDIARLGATSLAGVRHAGASGDTGDYPADEVQAMARQIAAEAARSAWFVQDREQADKLATAGPVPVVGDRGD